jgi:hypothetical protein
MQRSPQTHHKTLGVLASAVIWDYLGLALRLNGCGACNASNLLVVPFERSLAAYTFRSPP